MGDDMSASDSSGPGGTDVTRWHKFPSLPLRVLMNIVNFSEFAVWKDYVSHNKFSTLKVM